MPNATGAPTNVTTDDTSWTVQRRNVGSYADEVDAWRDAVERRALKPVVDRTPPGWGYPAYLRERAS